MIGEQRPQSGLRGLYHLENVNDSSGNGFNLTNVGTVTFPQGKFVNGIDLGATNSSKYLTISNTLGINNTNAGASTFGGWFNFHNVTSGQTLIGHAMNGGRQWEINVSSGTLYLQSYDGVTPQAVNSTMTSLQTGKWYQLIMTANGNTIAFYCNGDPCGGGSLTTNANTVSTNSFRIGLHPTVAAQYGLFKGDEVEAWNKVRTAKEIKKWYAWSVGKY